MEKSFKKSNLLFMILVILSGILLSITNYKQYIKAASKPNLTYAVHIQDSGWLKTVGENQLAGSTGKGKRAEAIKINLKNSNGSSAISYSTHIQENGWQNYVTSGKVSGTTGKEKRIEAIKIKLTGNLSKIYDIYYRVHISEYGWLGWAKNNEKAGSEGISTAIEAIQIRLIKKGTKIKQSLAYIEKPELTYCSHISDVGWQSIVKESNVSGTTGEGKRMEAMKLYLKNSNGSSAISYNAHLAGIGWQGWKSSGEVSGTVGEQRQVEAVKIKLTGLASELFHIYYRVHVRGYGWLGWAKDGELAGTEGANLRIEAIQIEILPKGQSKEQTISGFIKPTLTYQTHVSNIGWQSSVSEGMIAGTTEQSKAIEAMVINFNDASGNSGISYNLHLQGIGWQGWKSSGEMAGTIGEERRAEAIQIKLSDTLAQDYDVYYRTYIENHGWLAYAKNGETAGSSGLSLRMEALQIYIISKYVNFDQGDIAYVTQENVILPPNQGSGTNTNNTKPTCVGTAGVNLIKSFEGCKLTAYKPVPTEQYYTIGWGHYGPDVKKGMSISQTQADNLLLQDLKEYEGYLNNFLNSYNISISQEQYDALLSFTYNLGNQWVKTPTFQLKTILINGANNSTSEQIRTAFTNWNKAGGKVLAGLTRRRNAEAELFLSGM